MQPIMTMTINTDKNGVDAPEDLNQAVKDAINELTPEERTELLFLIKESRCER